MGKTSIEWTDFSWNPTTGCTMGCKNCYARRMTERNLWGYDFTPQLHLERLTKHDNWPLGSKVFVCDMGDLFDPQVKFEWILKVFEVIEKYPQVTFQLLTKQVKRMVEIADRLRCRGFLRRLQNIWWGCTVRNQEEADLHIPELLKLKDLGAAVLYISAEPLLGPIDTTRWLSRSVEVAEHLPRGLTAAAAYIGPGFDGIDWVICGGETGPGARPMHPDWPRSLRRHCVAAGVPFFFKAWGEWLPKASLRLQSNEIIDPRIRWGVLNRSGEFFERTTLWNGREGDPQDDFEYIMLRLGRKKAGRLLDKREWSEFPINKEEAI